MLPFSHLGIGVTLVKRWKKSLPVISVLAGTLLPDLIDKSYFFLNGMPGKRGLCHTAIFVAVLMGVSKLRKSAHLEALSAGAATHILLDLFSKFTGRTESLVGALKVLLWPLFGVSFPILAYGIPFHYSLALEGLGALLLARQILQSRKA